MTREEALAQIRAADRDKRIASARSLAISALRVDIPALEAALSLEQDRWVRRHLDRAIRFAKDRRSNRRRLSLATDNERSDQLYGVAVAEVTHVLLHEINVLLGDIRRHAQRELVANQGVAYDESRTRLAVDRMGRLTRAIGGLNEAASPAEFMEFDLASMLKSLSEACSERHGFPVECVGPDPALVRSDPRLVELVVDQGIRNAVESSMAAHSTRPVRLTWVVDGEQVGVQVVDSGLGPPKGFDRAFRAVSTTKDKREHRGIGLMTASRAASSLGGHVTLNPRLEPGAVFELTFGSRPRT